jgi:hypothetical protein
MRLKRRSGERPDFAAIQKQLVGDASSPVYYTPEAPEKLHNPALCRTAETHPEGNMGQWVFSTI